MQTRKFTKDCHSEEYLKRVRNPVHKISVTKLRLGVYSLRIKPFVYLIIDNLLYV